MGKTSLILTLLVMQIATSFAQNTLVVTKKIVYKKVGERELSVDMFYTASSHQKKDNSAIAFFHGGGWVFGDPAEYYEACRRFARKGFVTFSFQYRLSINSDGTYPNPEITPVESTKDARSAIRWYLSRYKAGRFSSDFFLHFLEILLPGLFGLYNK